MWYRYGVVPYRLWRFCATLERPRRSKTKLVLKKKSFTHRLIYTLILSPCQYTHLTWVFQFYRGNWLGDLIFLYILMAQHFCPTETTNFWSQPFSLWLCLGPCLGGRAQKWCHLAWWPRMTMATVRTYGNSRSGYSILWNTTINN